MAGKCKREFSVKWVVAVSIPADNYINNNQPQSCVITITQPLINSINKMAEYIDKTGADRVLGYDGAATWYVEPPADVEAHINNNTTHMLTETYLQRIERSVSYLGVWWQGLYYTDNRLPVEVTTPCLHPQTLTNYYEVAKMNQDEEE